MGGIDRALDLPDHVQQLAGRLVDEGDGHVLSQVVERRVRIGHEEGELIEGLLDIVADAQQPGHKIVQTQNFVNREDARQIAEVIIQVAGVGLGERQVRHRDDDFGALRHGHPHDAHVDFHAP